MPDCLKNVDFLTLVKGERTQNISWKIRAIRTESRDTKSTYASAWGGRGEEIYALNRIARRCAKQENWKAISGACSIDLIARDMEVNYN